MGGSQQESTHPALLKQDGEPASTAQPLSKQEGQEEPAIPIWLNTMVSVRAFLSLQRSNLRLAVGD